jgi:hypothetical protein
MVLTSTLFQSHELSKNDFIKIPTVISNKVLMAPGNWNGVSYSAEEIKKAFENTDWSDKDITSVILDHSDKPLKVSDWTGWVKNPRLEGDSLVGDLELYDEPVLIKLTQAKAKFGISPRVKGLEESGQFKNFTFENFSIVTNPAVKKAYINLSQKEMKGGKMESKEMNSEDAIEEETIENEAEEEVDEELSKKSKVNKCGKKKKYPPEEEVMSEEDILEVTTSSDWTDFVAQMRKKYPKMSLQDIAKAFKSKSKEDEELEQLSEEELLSRIGKLTGILSRKKKYPYPQEESKQIKENKEVQELSQKITEMEKRLNEPDAKSVISQELSDKTRMVTPHTSGVQAFAEYLQKEFIK